MFAHIVPVKIGFLGYNLVSCCKQSASYCNCDYRVQAKYNFIVFKKLNPVKRWFICKYCLRFRYEGLDSRSFCDVTFGFCIDNHSVGMDSKTSPAKQIERDYRKIKDTFHLIFPGRYDGWCTVVRVLVSNNLYITRNFMKIQ